MVDAVAKVAVRCICRTWAWSTLPLLEILASVYGNESFDLAPTVLQQLLDFLYFRSKMIQSSFNYHMNYLHHTRGVYADSCHGGDCAQCTSVHGVLKLKQVRISTRSRSNNQGVAVLLHGLLTSTDTFIASKISIAQYLHQNGYETWIVDPERSANNQLVSGSTSGPWQVSTLLQIAEHVLSHSDGAVSVTWIAHSTACGDLLPAFGADSGSDSSADRDSLIQLRNLTANIFLLSPVVYPSNGSERCHDLGRLQWECERPQPSLPLVGEELLGGEGRRLLQALPLWRDLLTPAAYSAYVVSPIARLALGWAFHNISPRRRRELLPSLFPPAQSNNLLGRYSQFSRQPGGLGNRTTLQSLVRWCCHQVAGVVIAVARSLICSGAQDSDRHTTRVELPLILEARSVSQPLPACRVTAIVGTYDPLVDPCCLEAALAQLEAEVHIVSGYEHMDTLWADDVADEVFGIIIERGTRK